MSRTWKDKIRTKGGHDPNHPYFKYGWWGKHGSSKTRRAYNRRDRRRNKRRLQQGKDAIPFRRYLPWIWW